MKVWKCRASRQKGKHTFELLYEVWRFPVNRWDIGARCWQRCFNNVLVSKTNMKWDNDQSTVDESPYRSGTYRTAHARLADNHLWQFYEDKNKNEIRNFISLKSKLTETQKSGSAFARSKSTSWPIECAASITLHTPSSLHICTISFQGRRTPGLETMLSITATRFLLGETGWARRWSLNASRICDWVVGKFKATFEKEGCGGTSDMLRDVRNTDP